MKIKEGERVGAIQKSTETQVYFYGFGIYEGDHPLPEDIFPGAMGMLNPRIRLDDGKVVWGCEAWWGGEEFIKGYIGEKEVVKVDIEEMRKRYA
jgi:hypothetical protein